MLRYTYTFRNVHRAACVSVVSETQWVRQTETEFERGVWQISVTMCLRDSSRVLYTCCLWWSTHIKEKQASHGAEAANSHITKTTVIQSLRFWRLPSLYRQRFVYSHFIQRQSGKEGDPTTKALWHQKDDHLQCHDTYFINFFLFIFCFSCHIYVSNSFY